MIFDKYADYQIAVQNLAKQLNVSEACATDVFYLRSRVRWTEALEEELIRLHKKGTPPNVMEFGTPSEAMKKFVDSTCQPVW